MRKLSNITESIWSNIQDRRGSKSVRKEDDVNSMDPERFCEYLKSRYYVDNSVKQHPSSIFIKFPQYNSIQKNSNGGCFIDVPLFVFNGKKDKEHPNWINASNVQDVSSFTYYPYENVIRFDCSSREYCIIFLKLLKKRFDNPKEGISVDVNKQSIVGSSILVKGNITNKTFVEMIDFVIDKIKKPLIPVIVKNEKVK